MKNSKHILWLTAMLVAINFSGCGQKQKDSSKADPPALEAERGELSHEGEGAHEHN